MMRHLKIRALTVAGVLTVMAILPLRADADENSTDKFASGVGTGVFLAAGTLLPLVEDGDNGKEHSLRAADSLLTSAAITESLKHFIHEKRPDGSGDDSFPSQHATVAFAIATMQSEFHPKQAPYWYLGATLIAASRVHANRHHVKDVVAGAGIGYLTAHYEMKSKHGFLLAPFIHSRREGGGRGIAFSSNF